MSSLVVLASLSLAVQIVALAVITAGYFLKRRGDIVGHATLMFVAVVVHFSSFLLLMAPAFVSLYENGFILKLNALSLFTAIHASLGGMILAVGIWLVGMWHFREQVEHCIKRRIMMRWVFVLWASSIVLGIAVYILLYFPV